MRQFGLAFLGAGLALASFGYLAFLAMRQPDIPHWALDRKYSDPRSDFFEAPCGSHIHYRDEGRADGPAIILVHGYCASLHTWEAWVDRLSAHYRLISIDLPGHGLTRTPPGYRIDRSSFGGVIDAAAAHLGLDRFTLVGSSMGGAAAWDYARRRPEKVQALALIGAAGWTPRSNQDMCEPALLHLMRSPMGPLFRDLDSTPLMRRGLRASFADPGLAVDAMIERYVELSRAPMHRDVQMQLALNGAERLYASAEALGEIRAPTLVMHGAHDRLVPVTDGFKFAMTIPDAQLIVYENAGHIIQEEIPDLSAEDLHAFLEVALAREAAPLDEDRRIAA
jgi:pimeloyl-ACP methyl ester carboxylesterase